MNRGQLTTVAIGTAAVIFLLLAGPMLLGQVYVADDLGEFHLPLRAFYAQQLTHGEPFDWCPNLYCGFYLTGEGQVGVYHPLHLLLYHTMPLSIAFDLECWLSYPIMFAGMVLFLLRRRIRFAAAILGAIAFTFGSFNFLHFIHPNAVAVIAHLPWLLWAIDVMLCSTPTRHRGLAFCSLAALTASQWLLGYPQYVFFSLIVEVAYVLFLQINFPGLLKQNIQQSIKFVLWWLTAIVIGTLIAGVQLLPTFDALQHSVRQTPAMQLPDSGSFHPLNLIQLVGPYLFTTRVVGQNTHELAFYIGAIPLVLAILGVWKGLKTERYRPIVTATLVMALCSLFWAFGTYGPFSWLQTNVPLLNKFRLPCRAIVIFQLATAVLTAVGFSILLSQQIKAQKSSAMNAGLSRLWLLVPGSIVFAVTAPLLWPQYVATWPYLIVGPALIALAVGLVEALSRGSRWALAAMIIFAGVDLIAYGMNYAILGQTMTLNEFIQTTDVPPGKPNCRVALDLLAGTQFAPGQGSIRIGNRILLTGWKRADGYAGLEPSRRLDYREPAALQLAGVGWMSQISSQSNAWISLPPYQPRAWLVTKAVVSNSPVRELQQISIAEAALVDSPLELPTGRPGKVRTLKEQPGEFLFETDTNTQQLLVINESYHPGWQATIDGQIALILRVNGDFQGLVVPAGAHEIRLQFSPESLKFGRIASGCGLGLLVAALLLATGQNRRLSFPPSTSSPPAHQL